MTNPKSFFEFIKTIESQLLQLRDTDWQVQAIQCIPNFGEDISKCALWIILKGDVEKFIPKRMILNKSSDKAMPANLLQALSIIGREFELMKSREQSVADVEFNLGFESAARVDSVGAFNYFH